MSEGSRDGNGRDTASGQDSEAAAHSGADAECGGSEELPRIDFATFVLSMAHSALVHLGDAPNPADGECCVNLTMARQTIDLLALLQDKSKGNLTGEEEHVLSQSLFDLRMRYVEVASGK
jgi:hypothetical protein